MTQFHPGDDVFGWASGAYAENVCVPQGRLVLKPANVIFEQAAAVPIAGLTALEGLRDKGRIRPGHKVLINGASGGVGTFAVQIARSFGAGVTGVCSTRNVDMVRSIGAAEVIDYTEEDFTRREREYDLPLDLVGNRPLSDCRRVLKPDGVYVMVGGPKDRWTRHLARLVGMLLLSPLVRQRMVPMLTKYSQQDLVVLQGLLESAEVTPVIDRRYTLDEVREAFRYQGEGHARGKAVITVTGTPGPSRQE